MPASPNRLLEISIPFLQGHQRANSARYLWDNSDRGDDQFVILQRTISGRGVFCHAGETLDVPPGYAFLAVVPEPSRYFFPAGAGEPWVFSWLNFYGALALELCCDLRRRHGPVLPLPLRSPAGTVWQSLFARLEKRALADPHDAAIATFTFLLEWDRQLGHPHVGKSDPVETVKTICHTRFRESLGIKELAAETGLSREHLTRIFVQSQGVGPAGYLRRLRTQSAREMLKDGRYTRNEIALRCGFPSGRALNRALATTRTTRRSAKTRA